MTLKIFNSLKEKSFQNRFQSTQQRIARLKKLQTWIKNNENLIFAALKDDFNKPEFETNVSEVLILLTELKYFIQNLKSWMKDQSVSTPLSLLGHRSFIRAENKGVVLIISPWNYPFQLAVNPLIAAIAAGNTVVLKPSEQTPHTAKLISKMCAEIFETNDVIVELGDKNKTIELLTYPFDHVFFTGSTAVGRLIAKECAEKLIPYTLELGGKSPVIIDETADISDAIKKIHWAKYLNRGQTCVAPDYILIHESIKNVFIQKFKDYSEQLTSGNISHIITPAHEQRLLDLTGQKKLRSTELFDVQNLNHKMMSGEIFGPFSPVISYKNIDDAIAVTQQHPDPLALYLFSNSNSQIDYLLKKIPSGGVGINAVAVHLGNHHLPFGGRGQSGQGRYHGHFGFTEFSHQRAVIRHYFFNQLMQFAFPPYTELKDKFLRIIKTIST